jgi:hypothetical protein
MRIVALVDIHPLDGQKRGLSARISSGGAFFDLPISKEQAALLISKVGPAEPPAPAPPTEEEMNLFAQFTSDVGMSEDSLNDEYEDDEDDAL